MKRQPSPVIFLLCPVVFLATLPASHAASTAAPPPAKPVLTWQNVVSNVLARPGTVQPGDVYRVGIPRNDVKVSVGGVRLEPSFALTSYETFRSAGEGKGAEILLRGDLLLLPDEVNPVISRLMKGGFRITALHNHLIDETPRLMDLHFDSKGAAGALAATLRDAVGLTGMHLYPSASELLEEDAPPAEVAKEFQEVQRILGQEGSVTRRVLEIHVPRKEPVRNGSVEIPPSMGTCVCMDFQSAGRDELAATGEMVVVQDELTPVLQALRMGSLEVTAIHDYLMGEEPALKYVHFWGKGSPEEVATALRAALDQMALRR
jgi:Domain of Unknown Function (DUF1259)